MPYLQAGGEALAGLRALNIARAGTVVDGIVVNANVASRANLYVTSEGVAVPATGYRAIGGPNVAEALGGTIAPRPGGTYITFDDVTRLSPTEVRSLLQLPQIPSDVITFDTLFHVRSLRIPRGFQGRGNLPEPFATTNPQFGRGGGTQAVTDLPINPSTVRPLPTGGK